ncbi:hypothetical protein [Phytohabitans houttuyneae]|uniref:FXSXX-COOH protein n=1 Tax=Phytohabitans houttuyneae TaxID=1076126 RepID=A0A6V8K5B1_9ACTN|nr:hypothetical protein [Phytohabitans houttuyneae]GFJ78944.1 hypothetical protein Phou_031240 [Phytohabitans houttuyneae]
MVDAAGSGAGSTPQDAGLVDVAGISLNHLLDADGDSPVLRSIRRLQSGLNDPNGVLSAFSSFLDES